MIDDDTARLVRDKKFLVAALQKIRGGETTTHDVIEPHRLFAITGQPSHRARRVHPRTASGGRERRSAVNRITIITEAGLRLQIDRARGVSVRADRRVVVHAAGQDVKVDLPPTAAVTY